MKGKFISVVLTLAVCLGLLLVPAAVGVSAGDPPAGEATYKLPAEIYVIPYEAFTVNCTIYNPHNIDIYTAGMDLMWNVPAMLSVTSVHDYPWPTYVGAYTNNTLGEVFYEGGGAAQPPEAIHYLNDTNILHCQIDFVAGSSEGVVMVNFTPLTPNGETVLYNITTDDITNWTPDDMQNMTVIVGSPKLAVNVVGNGNVIVAPASGWVWDEVVDLAATADPGWVFVDWTGDVANVNNPTTTVTMNTVDMNMVTMTKTVTATFKELEPKLNVSTHQVNFSARVIGETTDDETVTILNTGGKVLDWAVGSPPDLEVGDYWTYFDSYYNASNPPSAGWNASRGGWYNNTLQINVTSATPGSDYMCSVNFTPAAQRMVYVTDAGEDLTVVVDNATLQLDEYTLDWEVFAVNLTAWIPIPQSPWYVELPASACVTYQYFGAHGWPYYNTKSWAYQITMFLHTPILDSSSTSPTLYAMVINETATVPGFPYPCYHIIHFFNPGDPANTTFKQVFWHDAVKSFVVEGDGSFFTYPPENIRSLITFSTAANPPALPGWLTCDSMHGSCGISPDSDIITLTANASGMTPGKHTGKFNISAPGSIQNEPIDVNFDVLEATTIDMCRSISLTGDSNKPGETVETYPGETFNVTVTFHTPVDLFNAISLTDLAPDGWEVYTERGWSTPSASEVRVAGNKVEIAWDGPYNATTPAGDYAIMLDFTAKYQVTVPATPTPGVNTWPDCDNTTAWAEYWYGPEGPHTSYISGKSDDCDSEVTVTVPGDIVGETRDVNADLLPDVDVALYRVGDKFTTSGDGVAEWSTEKVKFGSYSAKLTVPAGFTPSDEARVVIAYSGKVSSIESIGYWWIEESGNPNPTPDYPQVPYLIIELDTTGNGAADTWLAPHRDPAPLTIPTPWTEQITTHDGGTLAHPGFIAGNISDYDDDDVLAIKVMVGCWGAPNTLAGIGYVDDITINGVTYELESSEVALRSDESTPDYSDTAYITGEYWLWATKDRYCDLLTKPYADSGTMPPTRNLPHPDYLNFTTPLLLSEGFPLDFEGDYGLVPRACSMSYAMESINHWLFIPVEEVDEVFIPHPEWQLSDWKASDSIASWQVPS